MQSIQLVRRRGVVMTAILAGLGLGGLAVPAPAALVILAENSAAGVGGSGSFDVVLDDTGGSYQIGGFSIEPTVPAGSDVEFTAATTNTTEPYIFGTYQSAPSPFTFNTFPNTDLVASDADFTSPYYATITPGEVVGLGSITYNVASGSTAGSIVVSLADAGTSLSDLNGDPVAFTAGTGTITTSVPEPGSMVIFAAALMPLLSRRRRKVAAVSR